MTGCLSGRNELLANTNGKRQVGEPVPVQVAELSAAQTKFDKTAAATLDCDAFPASNNFFNSRGDALSY